MNGGNGIFDPHDTYRKGWEEGFNMYMKSSKDFRAYSETIPKESELYQGLIDGKTAAIEAMAHINHSYHAEANYKTGFNCGYAAKHDEKSYQATKKVFEQRGGAFLQGFNDGGRLYDVDRQKLLKEGSKKETKEIKKPTYRR